MPESELVRPRALLCPSSECWELLEKSKFSNSTSVDQRTHLILVFSKAQVGRPQAGSYSNLSRVDKVDFGRSFGRAGTCGLKQKSGKMIKSINSVKFSISTHGTTALNGCFSVRNLSHPLRLKFGAAQIKAEDYTL